MTVEVTQKKDTRLDLAQRAYARGDRRTCRLARCARPFAYDPEETTAFYCSSAHAVEAYVAKHPEMFSPGYQDKWRQELAAREEARSRRADAGRERLAKLRAEGKLPRRAATPDGAGRGGQAMLAAAEKLGPAGTVVTYAGKNAGMRGRTGTVVGYGRDGGARVSFSGRLFSCSPLSLSPARGDVPVSKTKTKTKTRTRTRTRTKTKTKTRTKELRR